MTNKEKLEKAGWKFICEKQGKEGLVTHLYEDPETGRMHSQSTAMEIERTRRIKARGY